MIEAVVTSFYKNDILFWKGNLMYRLIIANLRENISKDHEKIVECKLLDTLGYKKKKFPS